MKKIFIIIAVFISLISKAQLPTGFPIQQSTGWIKWGYVKADSGQIDAVRDTNWLPRFAGTRVYWQNAGVDSCVWLFNGNTTGKRWVKQLSGIATTIAADNGLTLSGSTVKLGGTLLQNTYIDGGGYRMFYDYLSQFKLGHGDSTNMPLPSRFLSTLSSTQSSDADINGIFRSNQLNSTSGSIQGVEGYTKTSHTTGTVNTAIGTIGNVEVGGAGAVTEARGLQGGLIVTGNGNVGDAKSIYANPPTFVGTTSSTIDRAFGIYVDLFNSSGGVGTFTNKYNIFTSDAGAKNYFTGNTDIVSGNVRIANLGGNGTGVVGVDNSGNLSWTSGSSGTVTSVSALTLGTTGTDLTSTVANRHTTPVITLNVPTASASNRGALSAADWTTFNGKESALTFSTGLTRATNTITNNLSTGVSGGQTIIGGTASGNNLTYSSTSNATKGFHYWGSSTKMAFDETNGYLGLGIATAASPFHVRNNGALSTPAAKFDGTWITGGTATTTKPYILIEPNGTTSTAWSTNGTGLGVNAASGFTGRLLELQLAGVSKFNVDYTGTLTTTASMIIGGNFVIGSGQGFFNMANSGTPSSLFATQGGIISGSQTGSMFTFAGATNIKLRASMAGATSSTLAANDSYANVVVGASPITEASSGTHSLLANMVVQPVGAVTNAGAAVTNTASLYVNGAGSATGATNYSLWVAGAGASKVDGNLIMDAPITLKGYTVATLPTGTIGMTCYVTDALAPTFGAVAVGGGAVKRPVFYDGTNWIY